MTLTHSIRTLFEVLIRGEASGVSQSQLAQVDHYLLQSRQDLDLEMSSYRSAVDDLKVSLGLAPSTPIVLDERILQPFVKAFGSIDAWQQQSPTRPGIAGRASSPAAAAERPDNWRTIRRPDRSGHDSRGRVSAGVH